MSEFQLRTVGFDKGMRNLLDSTTGVLRSLVIDVVRDVYTTFGNFHPDYSIARAYAGEVLSDAWVDNHLNGATLWRRYQKLCDRAARYAAAEFPRLPVAMREEAVDKAADGLLGQTWTLFLPDGRIVAPLHLQWSAWRTNVNWRCLDQLRELHGQQLVPLDFWSTDDDADRSRLETVEFLQRLDADHGPDSGECERAVWSAAADLAKLLPVAASGPAAEKMAEVTAAAIAILDGGARYLDLRQQWALADDHRDVVYTTLRVLFPATWGRYPAELPTRTVLNDHAHLSDWHRAVEARRNDLLAGAPRRNNAASRMYLVLSMVQTCLEEAYEQLN